MASLITGIKVHANGDSLQVAPTPADYNCEDFLADILSATHKGPSRKNWTLKDATTGKLLQLNLTLEQNQVANNHDLYLISTLTVAARDIRLKVSAPDGAVIESEAPSSTNASVLLARLIKHFKLSESNPNGKPPHWILVRTETRKALDPTLSLAENDIDSKDELSIESMVQPDIEFDTWAPNGEVHHCTEPLDRNVNELLKGLLKSFDLPQTNLAGGPVRWILQSKTSGVKLDPAGTLAENDIGSGDQLLLMQIQGPEIVFAVTAPDGKNKYYEKRGEAVTGVLLQELTESLGLPKFTDHGKPRAWLLCDVKTGRAMDPARSLSENGVKTGDQLSLKEIAGNDLVLDVIFQDGQSRNYEKPRETPTRQFVLELIEAHRLSKLNKRGKPQNWSLVNTKSNTLLDPGKSLSDNGVVTQDRLLLEPEAEVNLNIKVLAPNGMTIPTQAIGDTPTAEFLRDLIASLKLPVTDEKGKLNQWVLSRSGFSRVLDPRKTLAENGVIDNETLKLKKQALPLKALAISGGALILIAVVAAIFHFLISIPPQPAPVTTVVTVAPKNATVAGGEKAKFSAQVSASDKAVWSISPAIGSISPDGVYSAPSTVTAQQPITVTATSTVDKTKSDSATITLLPPPITLTPAQTVLGQKGSTLFHASLRTDLGTNVQWSLSPDTGAGSITQDGLYTAPDFISAPQDVTVTAKSQTSPQYSASATITLTKSPQVRPLSASLIASASRQFQIMPDPGTPVQWSLYPAIGTISGKGLYTAPALISAQTRVTLSATITPPPGPGSGPDGTAIATPVIAKASIVLEPVVVGPVTATQSAKHDTSFHATVSNTTNTAVLWTINPVIGKIAADGTYTPPNRTHTGEVVVVTATSQADPNKSSSFQLPLQNSGPEITVSMNPHLSTLLPGQSEQFSAKIAGSSDRGITWSASGGGIILPSGLYTAPKNVTTRGITVQIIATSNADPEKKAMTSITVHPAPPYSGAKTGTVTWKKDKSPKTKDLIIIDNASTTGSLAGAFPGVAINAKSLTPNCSIEKKPSQDGGWKSLTLHCSKKQETISIEWTVE